MSTHMPVFGDRVIKDKTGIVKHMLAQWTHIQMQADLELVRKAVRLSIGNPRDSMKQVLESFGILDPKIQHRLGLAIQILDKQPDMIDKLPRARVLIVWSDNSLELRDYKR